MRFATAIMAGMLCGSAAMAMDSLTGGIERTGSSLSYGLNFHDDGDGDPFVENFTHSLVYRTDYALGGGWSLGASLSYAHETYDADFFSERYGFGLFPYMEFGSGELGAYFIASTNSSTPEQEYGIEGRYAIGMASVESYLGVFLDDGESEGTFGAAISYPVFGSWDLYAVHRRDYFDSGFDGLTTLGVTYALSGGDSGADSMPPLAVSFEVSKFHDEDEGVLGSGWQQVSLSLTYLFDGDRSSLFRGVRSVDYFYD